ncbi:hypothetical protein D9M68_890860 [compost metagenome]
MELPEVLRNTAHQAEQEERADVLPQGEGCHQCPQDGEAVRADSTAEPDAKRLGAVPPRRSGEGGFQPFGARHISCPMAVGQAATSRQEGGLGAEEVLRLSRSAQLGVWHHSSERCR